MVCQNITLIQDFGNLKYDYTLKVGILHLSKPTWDSTPNIPKSIKMILIDEKVFSIFITSIYFIVILLLIR